MERRESQAAVRRKKNKPPVAQTAEAYQRLLDIAAQSDAREGIRQGLKDVREGRVQPARAFFAEFESGHGVAR